MTSICKEELTNILNEGKIIRVSKEVSIATLWAGYGSVSSFKAVTKDSNRSIALIVKRVNPSNSVNDQSVSHQRKIRSYFVEAYFYKQLVPRMLLQWKKVKSDTSLPPTVPTPYSIEHSDKTSDSPSFTFLISDLRTNYRGSQSMYLTKSETESALNFLAKFHASFWEEDFDENLWVCGGYWHLDTRKDEYENISRNEWGSLKAIAYAIDRRMKNNGSSRHRVICHGDFKEANLLFKRHNDGSCDCAAVDYQYSGHGYGMKDVVMLIVSSVSPSVASNSGERELLQYYYKALTKSVKDVGKNISGLTLNELIVQYELCLVDYVRFMAGWGMWGSNCNYAAERVCFILNELEEIASQRWSTSKLGKLSESDLDTLINIRFPVLIES